VFKSEYDVYNHDSEDEQDAGRQIDRQALARRRNAMLSLQTNAASGAVTFNAVADRLRDDSDSDSDPPPPHKEPHGAVDNRPFGLFGDRSSRAGLRSKAAMSQTRTAQLSARDEKRIGALQRRQMRGTRDADLKLQMRRKRLSVQK